MSKLSTYFFTAWSAVLAALMIWALFMSGCASAPVKQDAPIVSAFIFIDHCDGSFLEAAFVRSDGSIVETDDVKQAKEMDTPVKDANGRMVPVYNGECVQKL
jgi:hypothetical protein